MNNLAIMYYQGDQGIEKNIKKAIELYEKAIMLGNSMVNKN